VNGYATAQDMQPISELMAQATQSTANLGWLQDYLLDWQTVRSLAIRIAVKQQEQKRVDEDARMALLSFIALATNKTEQLQEAYNKAYSKHERLMSRVLEGNGND